MSAAQKEIQEIEKSPESREWTQKQDSLKSLYFFFFALGLAVSLVYALQGFYPNLIGPISNIVPSITASGALLAALQNARRYGFRLRDRNYDRIWFGFTLGTFFWVTAEASWAIYYFAGVDVPYPGIPDIFYLSAYLPLALAVLWYFKSFSGGLTQIRKILSIGVIAFAASLVVSVVIPIEVSAPRALLTMITDLTYPVADLILLSLIILSLAIFAGGSMGRWWTVLATAIILDIIADELFLYQVAAGTYYNGGIDDLLYVWAYLLVGLSFAAHKREL
jgi:hypothetical protein